MNFGQAVAAGLAAGIGFAVAAVIVNRINDAAESRLDWW